MSVLMLPTRTLPSASLMLLGLLASGMDDQEIADLAGRERANVGTEVRRLLCTLDVPSRAAAVAWAYRHQRLVRIPAPRPEKPIVPNALRALEMLVAGRGEGEICAELGVTSKVLQRVRKPLAARTPAHLVRRAIDTGVVRLMPRGPGC